MLIAGTNGVLDQVRWNLRPAAGAARRAQRRSHQPRPGAEPAPV